VGQLCGGRVIGEPSVQRARAPTAGIESIIHQGFEFQAGNHTTEPHVQDGMDDDEEARAVRAEGFDPDDPVRAATW
jgi:hypothetical protein